MKNLAALFLTVLFSLPMLADVSLPEKEALLKLYQSTNGSQWTVKWDLTKPVSTWFGVRLEGEKVVSVNLSNNNLIGEIPDRYRQFDEFTGIRLA